MARSISSGPKSIYPQGARVAGLFGAALSNPVPPETTAGVVRQIIENGTWQLRHTSGPDAAPFVGWRASLTDEQWVEFSAMEDDAWYDAVQRDFGLDARKTYKT
jgi:hypothetical protein